MSSHDALATEFRVAIDNAVASARKAALEEALQAVEGLKTEEVPDPVGAYEGRRSVWLKKPTVQDAASAIRVLIEEEKG